ncbi:F0F1 ATP synthase subunit epsilon [Marinomonas mediterranea]|uniref:ATP synthase epsilon chain n=1 Tax=Marinomonas mediterranea (strain ATCC 700492 / JCM 21426 / NBRC 103028 / MMB-1) TaxID=717774 RepID=F2K1S6_MARM1|nr:F0F1 ATP synthase subunit epsilon [Marinomonas mediterranea]ADZ93410.1 ATP synthase epsilon chain [Marinomonas mediterranea MMB-1]WCN19402.1 F0F1 ATP synthase subunit epsilon [Marinomonas mediterranea MMB-1]
MSNMIQCSIVSLHETLFSGQVRYLVLTGDYGELGVHAGHAPLLTTLPPGPARLMKENGEEEILFLSGGFLEVQPDQAIVLADVAVRASQLDEEAALDAKQNAEKMLGDSADDIDHAKAMKELDDALARLKAIQALKNKG